MCFAIHAESERAHTFGNVQWTNRFIYQHLKHFDRHLEQHLPIPDIKYFLRINPNIAFFSLKVNSIDTMKKLIQEDIEVNEFFFWNSIPYCNVEFIGQPVITVRTKWFYFTPEIDWVNHQRTCNKFRRKVAAIEGYDRISKAFILKMSANTLRT